MFDISGTMKLLAERLPEGKIRDVALFRMADGTWIVEAGGHHSVMLGEYAGDYEAEGATAEEAITNCIKLIGGKL